MMCDVNAKRKTLMITGLIMLVGTVMAAEYSWVSGGSDNGWTTAGNWGGTGFPGKAGDIATLNAADTVNLNTNGVLAVSRLQLSSGTPKTVTLTGDAGAGFLLSGLGPPNTGINVSGHAGNRLIVAPDIVNPSRIDKIGEGAVEFTGNIACTRTDNTYALVLGKGRTTLSGSATITATNSVVGISNGAYSELRLTNSAVLNARELQLGVASSSLTEGHLWQDSDGCSVAATYLNLGCFGAGNTNAFYHLRRGTLTAASMNVGYKFPGFFEQSGGTSTVASLCVDQGSFNQTGGDSIVSAFAVGNTNKVGSVTLAGGKMSLNGDVTTPWIATKQCFNFCGGVLQVTNTHTCAIPIYLSGRAVVDTPVAGKAFTLRAGIHGNGHLVKTGPGNLGLGSDSGRTELSGTLTISNGVFNVGPNTLLESYNNSLEPLVLKIYSNGVFRLAAIDSVVTVPLALEIESDGKVDFAWSTVNYNRNILVAHSIVTNGVSLPPGRYTTAHGFLTGSTTSCSVVIPVVWSGAGDGVSWSDAANWEGGVVPNATTAVADISNAQQALQLDSGVTLTCLVYNPQGSKRSLTLTGNGSLTLNMAISYSAGLFVGPGRTLTLDIALERTPDNSTAVFTGGGSVIVKKKFPSIGPWQSSAFALYGDLVFAGVTVMDTFLGMYRHEMNSVGSVIFTNGCQLSCTRILNNPSAFYPLRQIYHDGGEVTCGDVFFTRHNHNEASPYTYFMRSGTLTTTNPNGVCLGVFYTGSWVRYSGGSFVMSGGTVSTARFAMGMPDNVLDLHDGEVNLGSGGIISTTNNFQGTVKLGGVALRAAANWASTLNLTLTGEGGSTLLDTAARTVTLSGALSGAGGMIKTGTGTLNLNGATNTFTGPLVVSAGTLACGAASVFDGLSEIIVTNGTLVMNGTVLPSGVTLRMGGTGNLIMGSGTELPVERYYFNGTLQPAGSYSFGAGAVIVAPTANIIWSGAAQDGALWSNLDNWANTLTVPDGEDVALDFGYSQLSDDAQIVLDVAPGVTLTNLVYGHGVPGVLTLTCPAAVTNVLTFVSNGVIRVEAGQTLVLDTNVLLKGPLRKYGAGTLILNRRVYGETEADSFWFLIMEGRVRGRGAISRVRVQPASASLLVPPPEFILEGEAAVVSDHVITLPGYQNQNKDRGVFTQDGGVVDQSSLPAGFYTGDWGSVLTYGVDTEGVYNLRSGSYTTCPARPSYLAGGGGTAAFNQTGGTSTFHRLSLSWVWPRLGGQGMLNLSGGTLRLAGTVEKGNGEGYLSFAGGRVEMLSNGTAFAPDVPATLTTGAAGDVAFVQAQASYINTLTGILSGNGGLVQTGPGTLSLEGINAFSGSLAVSGGTLLVKSELSKVTDIFADGGRLELLAATPCLTNLAVRVAGSAVQFGGSAIPFPEGLTLSLAQGIVTELDFDGIVEVDRLILGGRARIPGLYGGPDSAAPQASASVYFTGTGALRVLNGPWPSGTLMLLR